MNPLPMYGVIPPLLTPFTKSGEVEYEAFAFNLERLNEAKLGGYLVLGSNGETPYLTETEKLRLIESTVTHAAKGRVVIAGTGLESTRETIRLTNLAAGLGAQAALILTPAFYSGQMHDEAQVRHFRSVAEGSHIPILIYNVPAYTKLVISIAAVQALSTHPNIIGMKDSSGDVPRLKALRELVPPAFQLIVGSAGAWYPALTLGVQAGILALSNIAGDACARVQELYEEGMQEEAGALFERLVPVNKAITSTYGVPGLKFAATKLGYMGGSVRSPLLDLPESSRGDVLRILNEAGLIEPMIEHHIQKGTLS